MGRAVGDPRPLPQFFWQYHVFVDPVLAAKYPPGHSLLLAAGYLAGAPWLIPLMLAGINAGLLYLLARRWIGRGPAALAVVCAATSGISMRFWPSYFSETTTATLFLVAWWGLVRHWETGANRWLLVLAGAISLGEITRPVTMLAFAAIAAMPTLASLRKHHSWSQAIPAVALGGAVFGASLAWNARVTGVPQRMPFAEYARRYTPTDRMGFGASSDRPADTVSTELLRYAQLDRRMHERYTPKSMGNAIATRIALIAQGTWNYAGLPIILLFAASAGLPRSVFRIVVATVLAVFAAYLGYGHIASWTVYYLELQAPLAFLTVVGIVVVAERLTKRWVGRGRGLGADSSLTRRALFMTGAAVLIFPSAVEARASRNAHIADRALIDAFDAAIRTMPAGPAVVFVRERSEEHPERTVVDNVVDLNAASLWTVHDRAEENRSLLPLVRGRALYRLDEERSNGLVRFRVTDLTIP
jgi:hypothetical protein